jgi:hypothetical protein
VVGAAQAVLFVAPEKKIGTAVSAPAVDESYVPGGVAKGDQLLSQKSNPHRRAIGLSNVRYL